MTHTSLELRENQQASSTTVPPNAGGPLARDMPFDALQGAGTPVWLPARCNDWKALEALGVRHLPPRQPLKLSVGQIEDVYYVPAIIPNGWRIEEVPDRLYFKFRLIDEQGRHRAEIEDSHIEGRFVSLDVLPRFGVEELEIGRKQLVVAVDREQNKELLRRVYRYPRRLRPEDWVDPLSVAHDYLTQRYPDYYSPTAYWGETLPKRRSRRNKSTA